MVQVTLHQFLLFKMQSKQRGCIQTYTVLILSRSFKAETLRPCVSAARKHYYIDLVYIICKNMFSHPLTFLPTGPFVYLTLIGNFCFLQWKDRRRKFLSWGYKLGHLLKTVYMYIFKRLVTKKHLLMYLLYLYLYLFLCQFGVPCLVIQNTMYVFNKFF